MVLLQPFPKISGRSKEYGSHLLSPNEAEENHEWTRLAAFEKPFFRLVSFVFIRVHS
jgi:hypothetical protein